MKLTNFFTKQIINEAKADPNVVAKFKDIDAKHRSYYITKWADENGIDSDEAMELAGYERDGYMGAGAWNWRYVAEEVTQPSLNKESLEALAKHIKEGVPLVDSLFRYQSDAYFDTFNYAKKLREAGSLPELDWESEEMLGTDIGESVVLENGETVWLDVPYLEEGEDDGVNDSGMIGEPDDYYDEEERKQAYDQLQDALDMTGRWEHDYVKDGICPNCGGSGYQDGEDEIWDEEEGEYVEGNECDGWSSYGCDQGEMMGAEWKEIMDHDKRQAERQALKDKPQPSDEELENAMKQLHTSYVKSGQMNAFELPSILRQMYPEISKPKAREIGGKFFKSFGEAVDQGSGEGEAMVAKMLAKALGDDNRWADMSAAELYAELESVEPKKADMIALVAKMLYDVKLQERAYKDVGVADVVKDKRGKEFKFDKGSKKFKSVDGEEAAVNTTLGKDLMRIRRNAMKRTSPSYNKEDVDVNEAEYNGKKVKLNKPMRSSGGGKKYKVYVKNPKTGRVKKISFGDAGLKTKSSNKKRAKSFAARHNCEKKNDKMKAGYWACRLPRYGLVKGGKWW